MPVPGRLQASRNLSRSLYSPAPPATATAVSSVHGSLHERAGSGRRHYAVRGPAPGPPSTGFTNPNAYYPDTEITDQSVLGEMMAATPAYEPWAAMAARVRTAPPRVGDMVEFRVGAEVRFGLVVAPPACLFNQFHNRLVVLTMQNELVRACVQDYTFVCLQVLHQEAVAAAELLRHRFDEEHPPRRRLVQYLHQFSAMVAELRRRVDMRQVYLAVAGPGPRGVSLHRVAADVARTWPGWTGPASVHQNALLLALYLNMCSNPADWIVPHCYDADRWSNVSFHHSSNGLAPPPCFLATPLALSQVVGEFMAFSEQELLHVGATLAARLEAAAEWSPSAAYDQVTLDLTVGNPRLRTVVEAAKYAVAYPHAELTRLLSKVPAFGPLASPRALHTALVGLGLYDNPCNPLTDPMLLSQVLGAVLPKTVVACTPRDLVPGHTHQVAKAEAKAFRDRFLHLRPAGGRVAGPQKVYLVPGLHGTLAFSLEQLNSRRHLLHIHVPDPAAVIAPASETFKAWAQNPGERGDRAFPAEARGYMHFQPNAQPSAARFIKAADVLSSNGEASTQTCMTLTFEYSASFADSARAFLQLVKVTFGRVARDRMVDFGGAVLEAALTGKLEQSVFKRLRLFGRKPTAAPAAISDEAHYELNFVFNMMRRHYEFRNRRSALNVAAAGMHKRPGKKHTVAGELVHTDVTIETEPEKSGFLRRELEIFAGRMAAAFAERNGVPVMSRRRWLVFPDPRPDYDEVLIRHENPLLPDFTANSYFQAAYARDVSGAVSTLAFFHASNFVGPEEVGVWGADGRDGGDADDGADGGRVAAHVTLGVDGSVKIVPGSVEAYINQLQILQAVHFSSLSCTALYPKSRDFAPLKAHGYNLHGPSDPALLTQHAEELHTAAQAWQYLNTKQRRYWTLKAVEMHPDRHTHMKCVVTRVSRDIDMEGADRSPADLLPGSRHFTGADSFNAESDPWPSSAVFVFCEDLGIEALMYLEPEPRTTLGLVKWASVYHVDAIQGRIILV